MTAAGRRAILVWLLALLACLLIVARSEFTADMSAFLPQRPTVEQRLLVEQIREGSLSRLLLIGIEGSDPAGRARLSQELAARLVASGRFASVRNGASEMFERDRQILFEHRYLLSPAVTAERFTVDGLRQAIGDSIDLLASPAGLFAKQLLPLDPTGEMMSLIGGLDSGGAPRNLHGVWVSKDGQRAILMAQTAVAGVDTDGQEQALAGLQAAFSASAQAAGIRDARLLYSGTPRFAVESRESIRSEVRRLAIIGTAAVVAVLLLVYRSLHALSIGLLPVLSGVVAGIAAVSLGFGSVHGITIGFGTTLIGEAVDYSIYYFVQSRAGQSDRDWQERFWPTIRLGVLTSLFGFTSLLFSGFPGLAQLGLYTIAGLTVAAVVTRHVLPYLRPARWRMADLEPMGLSLHRWVLALTRLRWSILLLAGVAAMILLTNRGEVWSTSLGSLSPLSATSMAIDESLRADLGAPDQRYLVVIGAEDRESVLRHAERIAAGLDELVRRDIISGYETPARFLPSDETQRRRQAALPDREQLSINLRRALADLPLREEKLAPFLDAVETARRQPLLREEALSGSTIALGVESMLVHGSSGWTALLPVQAPRSGPNAYQIAPATVQDMLRASGVPQALFIDVLGESNRLYGGYLDEAILLSLGGFFAIAILLAVSLRSVTRLLRVLAPLVAAVMVVIAGLTLAGGKLNLLHLVGMLLIVAVGSNYALFFDRPESLDDSAPNTLSSLVIANITTVIGFGILAFAKVPVLHTIGITVGPGAILALLFSAMLARPPQSAKQGRA